MNYLLIFLTGFLCSIPIDQSNLEVIRRGIIRDLKGALAVGVGNATGDSIYFLLLLIGLTKSVANPTMKLTFGIIGALLLMFLGLNRIHPFLKVSGRRFVVITGTPFIYGLVFSLLDPTSSIGALGVIELLKVKTATGLVKLVFTYLGGGVIWTFLLAGVFRFSSRYLNYRHILIIDRISGLGIFILGLLAMVFILKQTFFKIP